MSVDKAVVFGVPRSGTTFLMGSLDAMPEAECVTGNLLPIGITHLAAQELSVEVRDVLLRSFRGSLGEYLTTAAYFSRSAALRKWWASSRRLRDLRSATQGTRRETLLVYKEPFLAFSPEFAYEALPSAPIIHIYRDGRDVANSLIRTYDILTDEKLTSLETNEVVIGRKVGGLYVPWWVTADEQDVFLAAPPFVRAIWMWREMIRRTQKFLNRPDVLSSKRILEIRYEDFVRNPVDQGQVIANHLGRDLTSRMRKHLRTAHSRSVGAHNRYKENELHQAEEIAGAELEVLGYGLATARQRPSSKPD